MKRIFKTMLLALVLIGGGMSVTSCDEETISQILGLLLGGTTYTYSGTATLECFGPGENGGFREIVKGTASLQPSELKRYQCSQQSSPLLCLGKHD